MQGAFPTACPSLRIELKRQQVLRGSRCCGPLDHSSSSCMVTLAMTQAVRQRAAGRRLARRHSLVTALCELGCVPLRASHRTYSSTWLAAAAGWLVARVAAAAKLLGAGRCLPYCGLSRGTLGHRLALGHVLLLFLVEPAHSHGRGQCERACTCMPNFIIINFFFRPPRHRQIIHGARQPK